jgi:DNA recombination protein RmuC
MGDVLLVIVVLVGACTLALATIILMRLSRIVAPQPLTKEIVSHLLRGETDLINKSGHDQARGLRQELTLTLNSFQNSTNKAFSTLVEFVSTQTRAFGERLDTGIKTIDDRVAGIADKLNADIAKMGDEAAQNRDALRQAIELKLDTSAVKAADDAKELRGELNGSFHRLGGNVSQTLTQLSEQQRERLEKVTLALDTLTQKNEKSHDALRLSVEQRLDAIRQESANKLEEMRQTVDEKLQKTLESRLGESFNRVVEHLARVHEGLGEMRSLASNVGDLKNVLTNVKVRGTFGEVQLELLLEQFLAPDQYVKGAQVRDNSSERVEFAIRLPGKAAGEEVLLAVDAKFPRENYDKLIEASQAGDAKLFEHYRKQLEGQIRSCAKEICEKYVNPPRTTDFAILFVPTEGLYAEVLRQPGVFESIQREHKVTLAGPTTFSAILNALQMGFRTLAIEKRSSEVWQILGAVQSEFKKYNTVVERLGRQLNVAVNSVDALGQRTRVMNKTLKKVEALPEGVSGAALLGFDGEDVEAVQDGEEGTFVPIHSEVAVPAND